MVTLFLLSTSNGAQNEKSGGRRGGWMEDPSSFCFKSFSLIL